MLFVLLIYFGSNIAHASAYTVLATPAAKTIAAKMGVKDPPTAAACLKCHATGYLDPAGGAGKAYDVGEGVGCEACHGAGSGYSGEKVMKNKAYKL